MHWELSDEQQLYAESLRDWLGGKAASEQLRSWFDAGDRYLDTYYSDAWLAANPCLKHLGLYAYHADLLEKFVALPPGRYEQIERLEQLRVLENGFDILVGTTEDPTIGVDTPDDAVKFEKWLG